MELRQRYPLKDLLELSGLPRSTYYYYCKQSVKDKYTTEKQVIKESQTLLRGQLSTSIKGIVEIANDNSNKEETRLKAYQYLVDRVLGNTTTKIEQNTDNSNKENTKVDIESTLKAIKNKNNVVELPIEKAE